ncbi:MAG: hypothetical protein ACO3XO_03325 [Bdellovibrionota bacterium]|jgi:hypothetical protein
MRSILETLPLNPLGLAVFAIAKVPGATRYPFGVAIFAIAKVPGDNTE